MSDSPVRGAFDANTLECIELAFPALLGGFEVHERDLEFDGRQIANWLAYSQGRVLLIQVVDGETDETVLRALDALSFARSQEEILASMLSEVALPEMEVQVVLVAVDGFSALQVERLSAIGGQELWLLDRRELRTKRGTHTRLETHVRTSASSGQGPAELPDWALNEPHRGFLTRIAPDRLDLAVSTIDRIRRVDATLGWTSLAGQLVCSLGEIELCRLRWQDGRLELMFDESQPPQAVRDRASIEEVVEGLLGVYLGTLAVLEQEAPTPSEQSPVITVESGSVPDLPELEPESDLEDLDFDGAPLEQVEMQPMPPGPLLTREEIEAFLE